MGYYLYFGSLTAFLTAVYSVRLLIFVFFKQSKAFKIVIYDFSEIDQRMLVSLLVLSFMAIFVGYFLSDVAYGNGFFF
jgi:NADH:ubiquinone oxidoreductase subunit 5 (subunit L)/multisubunit Na+/H+ antiporter MnhA subunit